MNWSAPQRPAAYAEQALTTAILNGTYPVGSTLPAERELAVQLGVTRPTLREALQRMERDGWLTIRQGKPTQVNDFWRSGGLNALTALVRFGPALPPDFVPNLLDVRLALAPAYTRAAVAHAPGEVAGLMERGLTIDDTAEAFAAYDWTVHYTLTLASGNPIYTLILNGFAGFYQTMARRYFSRVESRAASRTFYGALLAAARAGDADRAERISAQVMRESIELWQQTPTHSEEHSKRDR